uniref:Uncharacterized protein n=1 Tax=Siphoviridae sp. ctxMM9 TaxID=2827973 RepID=A0A8S5T680_9CAUD|nr:MAG TPA: hypothetical protein [Siphoviridae sp. ctxMM9]
MPVFIKTSTNHFVVQTISHSLNKSLAISDANRLRLTLFS